MPTTPYELDSILSYRSLSRAVDERKSVQSFLRPLIMGGGERDETYATETVDWQIVTGDRVVAPFVRRNGPARVISGYGERTVSIQPTNIKLLMNVEPWETLFKRTPGQPIYVDGKSAQAAQMRRQITMRQQRMADAIEHAEEYLVAMLAFQAGVTYADEIGDVFSITVPRPAGNNITLSTFWNDATPANVTPYEDINDVQKVLSNEVGLQATDCVMGEEAAEAFRKWVHNSALVADNRISFTDGVMAAAAPYTRAGVQFMGTYRGIRLWEYSRSLTVAGASVPLVRAKYAEFFCDGALSECVMGYGAIADLDAESGIFQGRRFSKTWTEKEPSVRRMIVQTRPMPMIRRPGAFVSVKVVSG